MLTARVGNSHGLASDDHPLDPSPAYQLAFDDHAPEQPRVTHDELFQAQLQDMFKHPRQREMTARLQKLVRAEVLTANQAVWARLEQLERRVAESSEAWPGRDKFQSAEWAAQMKVLSGSGGVDDETITASLQRQAKEIGEFAEKHSLIKRQLDDLRSQVDRLAKRGNECAQGARRESGYIDQEDADGDSNSRASSYNVKLEGHPPPDDGALGSSATDVDLAGLSSVAEDRIVARIEDSCWDACIFIGVPGVHFLCSVSLSIAAVANMIIQTAFVWVVVANLMERTVDEDTLDGYRRFRYQVAHDVQFADKANQVSLAAQICNQDRSLHLAGAQQLMYESLDEYLGDATLAGPALCGLCLLCWFLVILDEARADYTFARAICTQVSGPTTMRWNKKHTSLRLVSMSRRRTRLLITFVVFPRFAISLSMGFAGIFYISYTFEMRELLLNAMALCFILQLDELVYAVFAPANVKQMTRSLVALRVGVLCRNWRCNLFWGEAPLVMLLIVPALTLAHEFVLSPFLKQLRELKEILCGGNTDFVYSKSSANEAVYVAGTRPYESGVPTLTARAMKQAVGLGESWREHCANLNGTCCKDERQWIDRSGTCVPHLFLAKGLIQMEKIVLLPHFVNAWDACRTGGDCIRLSKMFMGETVADFDWVVKLSVSPLEKASEYLGCRDLQEADLDWLAGISVLRSKTNQSVQTCNDLLRFCGWANMSALRAWCPKTCGCGDPYSGQLFQGSLGGCPFKCVNRRPWPDRQPWQTVVGCIDWPGMQNPLAQYFPVEADAWLQLTTIGMRELFNVVVSPEKMDMFSNATQQLFEKGCAAVLPYNNFGSTFPREYCQGFEYTMSSSLAGVGPMSLIPWCPASCGCHSGSSWPSQSTFAQCPSNCSLPKTGPR